MIKRSIIFIPTLLLESGVDIKTTLELICEDINNKKDKILIEEIKERVINGLSLSEAVEKSGKFSSYEYYSLKIGEESGKILDVLQDLSQFFNRKIEQKRQIISAFSYPLMVLCTAIVVVFFMLKFIVPMFSDVFKRFNNDLPYLTKLVLNLSNVFSKYFYIVFLIILTIIAVLYIFRKKDWYRNYSSKILLSIPLIGEIARKIYIARFCLSMELLMSSKTPIMNAIKLLKIMIGFYPIEVSLQTIEKDILQGSSLNESMAKFKIFDKRMVSLIRVAEEVNQLDVIFNKLKTQYSKEVEHQTSLIGSVLEPVMIIFIGIFVAIILVSMYLPMFKLSTSIGF